MSESNIESLPARDAIKALYQVIEFSGTNWESSPFLGRVIGWLIDEDLSSGRKVDGSVKIGSCNFKVDPKDDFSRTFLYGYEHEPTLLDVCKAVCGKSSTIWDIGANFGFYAVQLAAHAGPGAHVTAFEPDRKVLDLLKYNIDANGLTDRITLASHAVGGVSKKAKFHQMANSAMSGLSDTGRSSQSDIYDVTVRTMDDVWKEQGCPPLSLIKIDIEGHEYEALAGGREMLANLPDTVVVFELSAKNYSGAASDKITNILLEFIDDGWCLLSSNADGRLVRLDINLANGPITVRGDSAIMVRAGSKQEKTVKATWNKFYKNHTMNLRDSLNPMLTLPYISRYVTHLLRTHGSTHSQNLKNSERVHSQNLMKKVKEISALKKSLSSREKDVALLADKVGGQKTTAAEERAKHDAIKTKLEQALKTSKQNAGEINALKKSLSSREKDVALLADKVEGLKTTAAEEHAKHIAIKVELEQALKTLRIEIELSRTAHNAT